MMIKQCKINLFGIKQMKKYFVKKNKNYKKQTQLFKNQTNFYLNYKKKKKIYR